MSDKKNIFYRPNINNYFETIKQTSTKEDINNYFETIKQTSTKEDIINIINETDYIKKAGVTKDLESLSLEELNELLKQYDKIKILNDSKIKNDYPAINSLINAGVLDEDEAIVLIQLSNDMKDLKNKLNILQNIDIEAIGDTVLENVPDNILQELNIFFGSNLISVKETDDTNSVLITTAQLKCLTKALNNNPKMVDKTKTPDEMATDIEDKINKAIPKIKLYFPLVLLVYMLLTKAISLVIGEINKLFRCKFKLDNVTWDWKVLGVDIGGEVSKWINNNIIMPINFFFNVTVSNLLSEIEYVPLKIITSGFSLIMNADKKSSVIVGKEDTVITSSDINKLGQEYQFINKYTIYDCKLMYVRIVNSYIQYTSKENGILQSKVFCGANIKFPSCDPNITISLPFISFVTGTGISGNNGMISTSGSLSKCLTDLIAANVAVQTVGTSDGVCSNDYNWNTAYANTASLIAQDILEYISMANTNQAAYYTNLANSIKEWKKLNSAELQTAFYTSASSISNIIGNIKNGFNNNETRNNVRTQLQVILELLVNIDAGITDLMNNAINPFIKNIFCCIVFILLSIASIIVNYVVLYGNPDKYGETLKDYESMVNNIRAFLSKEGRVEINTNKISENANLKRALTLIQALGDILESIGVMMQGQQLSLSLDTTMIHDLIDQIISEFATFFSTMTHSTINSYLSMIGVVSLNVPEIKEYIETDCYQAKFFINLIDAVTMKIPTYFDSFIAETFSLPMLKNFKSTITLSTESYSASIMIEMSRLLKMLSNYVFTAGLCYSDEQIINNAISDIISEEEETIFYANNIYENAVTATDIEQTDLITTEIDIDDIHVDYNVNHYGKYEFNNILQPIYAGNTMPEILLDGSNSTYGHIYDKLIHKNGAFTEFANESIKSNPMILHNIKSLETVSTIDMNKIIKKDNVSSIDWNYLEQNNLSLSKYEIRDKIMELLNIAK